MESDLECPVCLKIQRFTPYFLCLNGHTVCRDCKEKLSSCPECRGPYQKPEPTRNFLLERLIERDPDIVLPCRYKTCTFSGPKWERDHHEKDCKKKTALCNECGETIVQGSHECKFRLVLCPAGLCKACQGQDSCPHGGCGERVPASQVPLHLKEAHRLDCDDIYLDLTRPTGEFYYSDMTRMDSSGGSDLVTFKGETLLVRCQMNPKDNLCYIWLCHLASKSKKLQKPMEATIFGPRNQSVHYFMPVFSMDETVEEVFESGLVMGLPKNFKVPFEDHGLVFKFSFIPPPCKK